MDQIGGIYWKQQDLGEVTYKVIEPGVIELIKDTSKRYHVDKLHRKHIGVTYSKMLQWGYEYINPKEELFNKLYERLK